MIFTHYLCETLIFMIVYDRDDQCQVGRIVGIKFKNLNFPL